MPAPQQHISWHIWWKWGGDFAEISAQYKAARAQISLPHEQIVTRLRDQTRWAEKALSGPRILQ